MDMSETKNGKRKVTVGSVTVEVEAPSPEEVARNIRAGQEALARGLKALITPGVKLDLPKHVPRFYADPEAPNRVIRVLSGKRESGTFKNGRFVRSKVCR